VRRTWTPRTANATRPPNGPRQKPAQPSPHGSAGRQRSRGDSPRVTQVPKAWEARRPTPHNLPNHVASRFLPRPGNTATQSNFGLDSFSPPSHRPTVPDGLDPRFRSVLRTGSTSSPNRASTRRSRSCHGDSAVISRLEAPGSTARGGKRGHQQNTRAYIHTHTTTGCLWRNWPTTAGRFVLSFPIQRWYLTSPLPADEPALRCPHRPRKTGPLNVGLLPRLSPSPPSSSTRPTGASHLSRSPRLPPPSPPPSPLRLPQASLGESPPRPHPSPIYWAPWRLHIQGLFLPTC
jgi:hypothetical protein